MPNSKLKIALAIAVSLVSYSSMAAEDTTGKCLYDRGRLLALDENSFDQDAGGWRSLSQKQGCEIVAADLIQDYRDAHMNSGLLYWHEAQLRAVAGQYQEAIPLMEKSFMPESADKGGWNPYVEATIAFLRRDKSALEKAKAKLELVKPPPEDKDMPPIVDGYLVVKFADGITRKVRWPPNIDVVEGLWNCFDKPYVEAYKEVCRESSH